MVAASPLVAVAVAGSGSGSDSAVRTVASRLAMDRSLGPGYTDGDGKGRGHGAPDQSRGVLCLHFTVIEVHNAVHGQIHLSVVSTVVGRWYRSYNYTCPHNIHPKGDQTPTLHADALGVQPEVFYTLPQSTMFKLHAKQPFPRFPIKPPHQISKQTLHPSGIYLP